MGDRTALTEFWAKQSHAPTVQTMMLNKFADVVNERDSHDIISALPDFSDMRIVELGAGIGRYTSILAAKALHLTAVDIVESFIEENRKINGHMKNINFVVGEASALEIDTNSIDLVFTNWLMMYLTDGEVINFLKHTLDWLKVGGIMHIRESCSEPSKRKSSACAPTTVDQNDENPTHYRHVCQYLDVFRSASTLDKQKRVRYKFEVVWAKSVNTYVEVYGNWRQIEMLVRKTAVPQESLDHNQNISNGIRLEVSDDVVTLLKILKNESISGQSKYTSYTVAKQNTLAERSPVSKFVCKVVQKAAPAIKETLCLVLDENFCVSPFDVCEELDCAVYGIERCPYAYNFNLVKAVACQDKRLRLNFVPNLEDNDWSLPKNPIDAAIGCFLTKEATLGKIVKYLKTRLSTDGRLFLLEEAKTIDDISYLLKRANFNIIDIADVTDSVKALLTEASSKCRTDLPTLSKVYNNFTSTSSQWFFVIGSP